LPVSLSQSRVESSRLSGERVGPTLQILWSLLNVLARLAAGPRPPIDAKKSDMSPRGQAVPRQSWEARWGRDSWLPSKYGCTAFSVWLQASRLRRGCGGAAEGLRRGCVQSAPPHPPAHNGPIPRPGNVTTPAHEPHRLRT